jgi:hypothetical protein
VTPFFPLLEKTTDEMQSCLSHVEVTQLIIHRVFSCVYNFINVFFFFIKEFLAFIVHELLVDFHDLKFPISVLCQIFLLRPFPYVLEVPDSFKYKSPLIIAEFSVLAE